MSYRRIRDKNTLNGFWSSKSGSNARGLMTLEDFDRFHEMSEELDSTPNIYEVELTDSKHYFKDDFFNKYSDILNKLLELSDELEIVIVYECEISKIWFEDRNQVILELNHKGVD